MSSSVPSTCTHTDHSTKRVVFSQVEGPSLTPAPNPRPPQLLCREASLVWTRKLPLQIGRTDGMGPLEAKERWSETGHHVLDGGWVEPKGTVVQDRAARAGWGVGGGPRRGGGAHLQS